MVACGLAIAVEWQFGLRRQFGVRLSPHFELVWEFVARVRRQGLQIGGREGKSPGIAPSSRARFRPVFRMGGSTM
jgi:hypothetical protein